MDWLPVVEVAVVALVTEEYVVDEEVWVTVEVEGVEEDLVVEVVEEAEDEVEVDVDDTNPDQSTTPGEIEGVLPPIV